MRRLAAIALLLTLTGCAVSQWYPVTGAVVGAGVGSLGGPAVSAGSAGIGYGIGKGAQLMDENEELAETVDALSKGDVDKLLKDGLQRGMESQKGAIASAMDGVYDFLKLALIGIVLWNFIPLAYTWIIHRKTKKLDGKTK